MPDGLWKRLPTSSRPTAFQRYVYAADRAGVVPVCRRCGTSWDSGTHRHGSSREALGPDEWWARELASQLGVSRNSLLYWIEHGLVRARKESGGWQRWIVWADAKEMERLQDIATATLAPSIAGAGRQRPVSPHSRKGRLHDRYKSSKRS